MDKKHFLLRSTPCRPSFHLDMTAGERQVMYRHIAYWTDLTERRICMLFGPVSEGDTNWGLGIVEVDDVSEIQPMIDHDPACENGLMTYEFFPMRIGMVRG